MVATDDLASADLQPPWWRGPVGSLMISRPNEAVAQREYWEWSMAFSCRYNFVLTTLCKLSNP